MSILCRLFGHKQIDGPLQRTPHRPYTHIRHQRCARCKASFGFKRETHEWQTEPHLFNIVNGVDMDVLGYREPWER